jgi:hypothetical protein
MSADTTAGSGPVVFSYHSSDLARGAIDEAGALLETRFEALVVTVRQRFDVGFASVSGLAFDAADATAVREPAVAALMLPTPNGRLRNGEP